MFYRPENGHGLPHNPFNAIVTPRPIGWISTRGAAGDNLAPYSFFNGVAYTPPQVVFSSTEEKDSLRNLRETGVFAVNVVEYAMREKMNATSGTYPPGTDEFDLAGIEKAPCETIDCPRVAGAPATLECRVVQIVPLLGKANFLTIGEVTGIHLRDDCLVEGRFDVTRFQPIARLGYRDYSVVTDVFEMVRPDQS
ncbi:flavin reductase family protein [Albidovulum sp.]|uniref:flavin reductase family protein n=1 Tax=Albidovulum sp. TaxID=1872424 RepID=UPI001D274841|nr:flavin reductase family protein [Paracoccaceae bacterium]MCC0047068.1 flavin reductase family protein [Defluviimonas sp.]HPE26229.1 flavin reductase family protein [Albidovulum sp.]MCO5127874.1 flavin reductase family protein [Paracoccaceae bacterium]MCP5323329.1 flavin reductase family protein [Paracoccaceae bacterium]